MKAGRKQGADGAGEAWPLRPGRAEPAAAGSKRASYGGAERKRLLSLWKSSGLTARDFAAREGMRSSSVLYAWQHAVKVGRPVREAGGRARNPRGKTRRPYGDAERVAAVSAYRSSGLTQRSFAQVWGVSLKSLSSWLGRVARHGESGLKSRKPGRPKGSVGKRKLPAAAAAEVVAAAQAHPTFGLKKVSQYVLRFCGVKVAPATVRRALQRAGVPRPVPRARKAKRGPAAVRFFERARPNQLWQSDITTLWLARMSRHVYLTVFLDDHSRYVVGWSLQAHQKSSLVVECLQEALVAYGKPEEVLTDQGRQYFAWRGKSELQQLLKREGIAHVVSRSHHPETLGKTERLWETVKRELWERIDPRDVDEARERLGHFLSHYNHSRPHQGLDGSVPADRYFGLESEVRAALEQRLAENELLMAVGQAPRKPVYLVGQIDGQSVSLHGERGRLVISTPQGGRQEVDMEDLGGVLAVPQEESSDGRDGGEQGAAAGRQADLCAAGREAGLAGEGDLGGGECRAEGGGAPGVHVDPGAVAGAEDGGRAGEGFAGESGARLADVAVGTLWDAGGAAEATTLAREDRDGRSGERARGAVATAQGQQGSPGEADGGGGTDRDPAGTAAAPGAEGADDGRDRAVDGGKKEAASD
jgi:transposase InsO family protein